MRHIIELYPNWTEQDFNFLWEQCKTTFIKNYPFEVLNLFLEEEQKIHVLEKYKTLPIIWRTLYDDHLVGLHAGEIRGTKLFWLLGMVGYDKNGGREWLNSPPIPGKKRAREIFWDSLGVDGWTIELYVTDKQKGPSGYYNLENRTPAGNSRVLGPLSKVEYVKINR